MFSANFLQKFQGAQNAAVFLCSCTIVHRLVLHLASRTGHFDMAWLPRACVWHCYVRKVSHDHDIIGTVIVFRPNMRHHGVLKNLYAQTSPVPCSAFCGAAICSLVAQHRLNNSHRGNAGIDQTSYVRGSSIIFALNSQYNKLRHLAIRHPCSLSHFLLLAT